MPWESAGYCVPGLADSQVVLVDTPGLNEVDGASRAEMAHAAAARADLVLFVVDSDLNDTEYRALVELAASHKPLLLVLNKADLYRPDQLDDAAGRVPRAAARGDRRSGEHRHGPGRSARHRVRHRVGRRPRALRVAEAQAAGRRGAGADRRAAGRRRQSAASRSTPRSSPPTRATA